MAPARVAVRGPIGPRGGPGKPLPATKALGATLPHRARRGASRQHVPADPSVARGGASISEQSWQFQGLPELTYLLHDRDILVTACGRICMHRKKINLTTVLAGQRVGIKEVDEGIWIVSFMHYDLDYIDLEQRPFSPSTTRSARGCYPCLRYGVSPMSSGHTVGSLAEQEGFEPSIR
jgi:hypothetical protein